MRPVVEVLEPQRRPARRALAVDDGGSVALHALPANARIEGLRRTVLRGVGEPPPADAVLVAVVKVDGSGLVATEVSPSVVLELDRSGVRRQVVSGMRLPASAAYELVLPDQSRASFLLQLQRRLDRGGTVGVSGSGTRRSRVRSAEESQWWLLNDAPDLMQMGWRIVRDWVIDKVKSVGINQEVLTFATGMLIAGAVLGYTTYTQYQARKEAEARQADLTASLALAEAAQAASVASQASCLQERQELVEELGRQQEVSRLRAEHALGLALTRQEALELGGLRMGAPEVRELDELLEPALVASVEGRRELADGAADATPCLSQDSALGSALPRYLLLWQSDLALTCPVDYAAEDGGVRRVGRWGLSDRVAAEFGGAAHAASGSSAEALAGVLDDPRAEDRWSAFAVAVAYRHALETILRTRVTERAPALPGQAHLWALAFLDAYNRLPPPSGGAMDATLDTCIERVLAERARVDEPAGRGTALLPDLTAVAAGATPLRPTPTPGCAWPTDAFSLATVSALHTVARLAVAPNEGPPPPEFAP
jgi:hypothetical protein